MNKRERLHWVSGAIGVLYGLLMRGLLQTRLAKSSLAGPMLWVMSIAFIAVVPFAMGYLTVAMRARDGRVRTGERVLLPWAAVAISLGASLLLLWEGIICIVMLTPLALLCGSLGGLVAGAVVKPTRPQTATYSMIIVALLPLLVGPAEHRLGPGNEVRSVESQVTIRASTDTVWRNIERVRAIEGGELPPSWNRTIGFPRPVEATLSHEGLGGIRHATFEGGVLFIETIDVWQPQQRLGFSIHADSEHIPPTTLDEHVKVGGPYFDVLHGEYILEELPNGAVKLRLVSRHRVSTDFNWYARWWTDAVMRDVQRSILFVIRNRCEASTQ